MKPTVLLLMILTFAAGCEHPAQPSADGAGTGSSSHPGTPQSASTSVKETFILEDFVFPFFADCLGEVAVWTGSARFDDHIVTRGDGSVLVNGQGSLLPGNRITSSSGIWLPTQVRSNYAFELTPDGEDRRNMLNERITWRNQTTDDVMDVWFTIHLVVAGTGEVKRDVFVDHSCELRN
jgi:hypothetical protein